MTQREEVLQQALALPAEDRAFVAAALEESLSVPASNSGKSAPELLAELRGRSEAFRAGNTSARPAADVLVDQRQRQADEAKA